MTRFPADIQKEIDELDRKMASTWRELYQRRADLCDERDLAVDVQETLRKQRFFDRIGRAKH